MICPISKWLISIAFCSLLGNAHVTPAFALKLHTTNKQEINFHIITAEPNILISEKMISCKADIECEIVSAVRLYDYFNSTSYSYLPIKISLLTHDNQKLAFSARLIDFETVPIFGLKSVVKWNDFFATGTLKVDTVTGDTQFLANSPANLQRLEIDEDSHNFYLPATLHVESSIIGQKSLTRSDNAIKLQFSPPENIFNGDYLLALTNNQITGWETAMKSIAIKKGKTDPKIQLRFGESNILDLGPSIFRAYDGESFKRRLDYINKKETFIGRFFAHKAALKLFIDIQANEPKLSVYAEISSNKAEYYYWVSLIGFLKFISWLGFLYAIFLIGLNVMPLKFKKWLPESFSARVPIH